MKRKLAVLVEAVLVVTVLVVTARELTKRDAISPPTSLAGCEFHAAFVSFVSDSL